jgi:ABC-type multidrug transport system fused ATPase/permease subunit
VAAYAFLGTLDTFVGLYSIGQGGLAAADRVFEILDQKPLIVSAPGAPAATFEREIRFEDVVFSYEDGGPPVLDRLSFAIKPGERIALAGPSGGGKTTVVRLLLRFYDPQEGRITFDGVDARELDLASLRALFAVAPQDGFIADLTIAENISLGRPEAGREEIAAVVTGAGLDPVLAALPLGLYTRIGQGGRAISGGERQRVSLARAALRNAPILILDEATNALDADAEQQLQGWLDKTTAGRTRMTIAHRGAPDGRALLLAPRQ